MNFPKNLRYLRKKSGLRQEDMLGCLEITRSTWSNYEIGHTIPKLSDVIRISNFFGITLDDLIMHDLESDDPLPIKKGQRKPREYPISDKLSKVHEPSPAMMYLMQQIDQLRDEVNSMKEKDK